MSELSIGRLAWNILKLKPIKKRLPQYKIPGEYTRVSQHSKEKFLLNKAHSTPLSIAESLQLITKLKNKYDIMVSVGWKYSCRGRALKRASVVNAKFCYYYSIILPQKQMINKNEPLGCLRMGLVLHEFAHIITYEQERQLSNAAGRLIKIRPHGREFVHNFDKLLKEHVNAI